MDKLTRMHVLDPLEHSKINLSILIKDISLVNILHYVCSDDGMQVGLHEVEYQVDIFIIFRFENV